MKNIEIDYTLTPEELDMAQRLVPEIYNAKTVGPLMEVMDWEEEFHSDMKSKKGFVVKSKPFKKKTRDKEGKIITKGTKEMYGIHSPLFGTDWLDDNAFADRYSCSCGELIGKLYKGRKCPKCGTKVEYRDVDLTSGHFTSNGRIQKFIKCWKVVKLNLPMLATKVETKVQIAYVETKTIRNGISYLLKSVTKRTKGIA